MTHGNRQMSEAPESVRSMISKKIDALEAEERRTLQYASVEGTEFLSVVAASLLGVDEVDLEERLAHLEKTHRLIEVRGEEELPDGSLATRYRFSHALFRIFFMAIWSPSVASCFIDRLVNNC